MKHFVFTLFLLAGMSLSATTNNSVIVKIEDGNYRVTAVLGSKKSSGDTWIKAESRRLISENIHTAKGRFTTVVFTVNKRSPQINDNMRIKIKDREKGYLNWDDELTIEFCGPNPQVKEVNIEKVDDVTTIFLCGNSTVTDQENDPWASWGQMFPRWWNEKVSIANYAESGERTTSFMASKRWAAVMERAKKGDYILIEFGHNDEKDKGPGSGAWYNFSHNLKQMVDEAQRKECHVVLITPTARRRFVDGRIFNTHGDYPAAVKAICERENIPMIDLTQMTTEMYEAYGEEKSKRFLVHYPAGTYPGQDKELADNTHFNTFGAYEVSKCIIEGMLKLNLPIMQNLREGYQTFIPSQPDDWQKWQWPVTGQSDNVKPDGN